MSLYRNIFQNLNNPRVSHICIESSHIKCNYCKQVRRNVFPPYIKNFKIFVRVKFAAYQERTLHGCQPCISATMTKHGYYGGNFLKNDFFEALSNWEYWLNAYEWQTRNLARN